jgi:hypothetical protein
LEEIQEMLETSGGKIDHESISQLHYLEAAVCENLRLNGPANDNFRLYIAYVTSVVRAV